MKKSFVTRLLSISLAATMALSQGMTSYAANASDDTSVVAGSYTSTDEDATNEENSDSSGEEKSDDPGTGSGLEDETETGDNNQKDNDKADEESASDASSDASSEEESASDASSEASSDEEAASDASSLASSDEKDEVELPEGINPLPEGYKLSSSEQEMKDELEENGVLEQFESMTEGVDYAENEIVTLASDEEMAQLIAETYSGKLVDFSYGVATISLSDSELSVGDAFAYSLDNDYDLPLIEPNYYSDFVEPQISEDAELSAYVHSNNYFSERWYNDNYRDPFLNPENPHYQWHHSMINTYAAWGVTTGNSNVTVAVIDSGANTGHGDLGSPIEAVGISGYGAGDQNGHGTHVAGIIAGRLNGQMGAGVAPGVKLLVLRASSQGSSSGFTTANIWKALIYAGGLKVENMSETSFTSVKVVAGTRKADIVNMSLGGPFYSPYYQRIMDAMYEAGVTVVAAMGNECANQKSYPAALNHVIGVVAVTESGERSYYSDYGAWADIAAPGSRIYSASHSNNSGYVYMDGTSMACPVVAGACALYMSAYGHVDPDTMERVLKASTTGSAGAGTGAGILDLAKMFKGDTTAPLVSLVSASKVAGESQNGKAFTIPAEVNTSSVIYFTPMGFDAQDVSDSSFVRGKLSSANKGTTIVYTTDGTTPSVSNGSVVNGTVLGNTNGSIPSVNVSTLVKKDDPATKQKITVKAIAVTGMGVSSKVGTLVFTVDKTNKTAVALGTETVKITNAPKKLIAGKAIKLEAVVTDSSKASVSQKVTWKIDTFEGNLTKAQINAANGTLTTNATQTGKITVSCTTADTRATARATIEITKGYPINTIAINNGKVKDLSLKFNTNEKTLYETSSTISITTLTDTARHNLLKDSAYSYTDKTFQWTTSNSKVVKISESTGKSVNITGLSVGTAVITCKALDGSGKSAKITVRVGYDKKATSLVITNPTDKTAKPLTALSTYIGAAATTLKATVNYADGKTNRVTPVWTSSNEKIVKVSNGVVTPVAKGQANITCLVPDGSGKKVVVKVTVAQRVETVNVSGQQFVAPGTSAKFAATVTPATANNKNVKWEVPSAPAGVSIANGVLKLTKDVKPGTRITVKATAVDGSNKAGTFPVTVSPRATKVTITSGNKDVTGQGFVLSAKGMNGYAYPTTVQIKATADNGTANTTPVAYTTNNAKVATVDNNGKIVAVAKGAAVITATAQDGSGKKATVKISVVQPVESVTVTGQQSVAPGTSAKYTATVTPATANNKNVKWEVPSAPAGVTISNGVLKLSNAVKPGTKLTVKATAVDNPNKYGSLTITVSPRATKVTIKNGTKDVTGQAIVLSSKGISGYAYPTSVQLKATADNGTTNVTPIAYTTNNAKVATIDNNGKIVAVANGAAVITATAQDGSGKKATVKINVVQPVESVKVSGGQPIIPAGGSATYKAAVYPANATNKTVTWGLQDTSNGNRVPAGITITNGVVKVTKDAPANHVIRVVATHNIGDGNVVSGTASTFIVTTAKAGSVVVTAPYADKVVNATTSATGTTKTLNFVRLYSLDIPGNSKKENELTLSHEIYGTNNGKLTGTVPVVWASSNPKVVSVSATSGKSITITAHTAGTASITCTAQDGSGKKAIVNVSVIIPTSNIELVTGSNTISFNEDTMIYSAVGMGKSTTVKVAMGQAYGKPSITKTTWDYEIGFYNGSKFIKVPDSYKATYQKNKEMFSFANGKVTANATSAMNKAANKYANIVGVKSGAPAIRVIARSTDGTGHEASTVIIAVRPASYLGLYFIDANERPNTRVMPYHIAIIDSKKTDQAGFYISTNDSLGEFSVVSSNPDVASGFAEGNYLVVFPHSKGTAVFTVSTLDGSGLKTSVKVQVN